MGPSETRQAGRSLYTRKHGFGAVRMRRRWECCYRGSRRRRLPCRARGRGSRAEASPQQEAESAGRNSTGEESNQPRLHAPARVGLCFLQANDRVSVKEVRFIEFLLIGLQETIPTHTHKHTHTTQNISLLKCSTLFTRHSDESIHGRSILKLQIHALSLADSISLSNLVSHWMCSELLRYQ